jgi:hypothetical protein
VTDRSRVLFSALEVLDELQLNHFLCNGTLLGIVRDGALIPWDVDLDVGILGSADKEQLARVFGNVGFQVHDWGPGSDYLVFRSGDVLVDLNFFRERDCELVTLWRLPRRDLVSRKVTGLLRLLHLPLHRVGALWTLEGYAIPQSAALPLGGIAFKGKTVPVPATPEDVLEHVYGPDWRTPRQDYDWRRDGANNAFG